MPKPKYIKSQEPHYDPITDTIYAPDSIGEFYLHELFHARPDTILLNELKPYYENLNDNKLLNMGADLKFVKRTDPNHFFQPEELGARVAVARKILKDVDINEEFLNNLRKNENKYGDNVRDLLKMFNNKNLIQILNMKKQLIPKNQLGGPVARLAQPTNNRGSWGNRGQGNELQSAAENATSWIWDKITNAGDYIEDGIHWLIGAVDPNQTGAEAVQEHRDWREYHSQPQYELGVTENGDTIPVITYLPPQGGIAPLPTLPAGATGRLVEAHSKLVKPWINARAAEYRFASGVGNKKGISLDLTKSWLRYEKALKNYNDELAYMGITPSEVAVVTDKSKKLKDSKDFKKVVYRQNRETKPQTGKQKAAEQSSKYMVDGDGRHMGKQGRIALKEYDRVDELIDKYSTSDRRRLAKSKAKLASTTDLKLIELINENINLIRLEYLRRYSGYLKEVDKLYNHLENTLGSKLDKFINRSK